MAKAKSAEDVVLGEAKAGNYQDMVAIASVIENRSRSLGVTYEQVVQNQKEFNAYNKSLPPGVNQYRDMAKRAIEQVKENGPVHNATFYATPAAKKGLPAGLSYVTETAGHQFFADPQNRAIGTSLGYVQPTQAPMNVAGQPPETLYDVANPPTPAARPDDTASISGVSTPDTLGVSTSSPRGLAGLSPSFSPGSKGLLSTFDRTGLAPSAQSMIDKMSAAGFGSLGVNSGYRSESKNTEVGGAKRSTHMGGKAVDLATKDLSTQDKSRVLDAALSAGAKGIGLYNSGTMHIDSRSSPGFWGPAGYSNPGNTLDEKVQNMPEWARADLQALVDANEFGYLPSGVNNNVPTPSARPSPTSISVPGSISMPTQGPLMETPTPSAAQQINAMTPDISMPPAPQTVDQQINAMTPAISMPTELPSFANVPPSVPASVPVPTPAPRVALPAPVIAPPPQPVAAPAMSRPTAPVSMPSQFTGQDVWSGKAQAGTATNGNQMSRNPDGTVSMTSGKFGYTETMNPDGSYHSTTAPGLFGIDAAANNAFGGIGQTQGIQGPLGQPGIQSQPSTQKSQTSGSRIGSSLRGAAGGVAGGMVGGLLGPVGSLLGSYLGTQMAQGKNPLGGLLGQTPQQTFQRGFTPGLAFPDQPQGASSQGGLTAFGEAAGRGEFGGQAEHAANNPGTGLF